MTTPGKPKKGEALRVNDRFSVEDWDFAERLWRDGGLEELLKDGGDAHAGEDGYREQDRDRLKKLWYVCLRSPRHVVIWKW